MVTSRRKVLRILGSSAVVVAAGGAGFAFTRTPTAAMAPWRSAGQGYSDARLRALSYAILAPNPHNRQPWMVDLSAADRVRLTCDPDRRLPETDPYDRQITIGLGCFVELAQIAAAADGYRTRIELFPQGEPGERLDTAPVADIFFEQSAAVQADPLFEQVLKRRTNKEPYDTGRPVDVSTLDALSTVTRPQAILGVTNEEQLVGAIRDLTWRAHEVETLTPRTFVESVRLMRIGKSEIERNPDGIDIGGVFPEALMHAGVLTRETMVDMDSGAFEQGMQMYREIIGSAMGHIWLTTPGNDRPDQIAAGRAWLRVHLKATELGLDLHPLSQALQEYPEVDSLRRELLTLLDIAPGHTLQMLGRVGYGPVIDPSPRWPLDKAIVPS